MNTINRRRFLQTATAATVGLPAARVAAGEPCPGPTFRFNDGEPLPSVVCKGTTYLILPPLLGIGRAKIHRVRGAWPARLVLRTEAPALEGFGRATPYDDAPRRRVGKYIEIAIPPKWYADGPKFIPITWVDYFR